ncbi:hypothetical protein LTR27_006721 [Elasticomyces elasticus]|nr:hypothetical protein LTR27_006721 [Elasticomyces elasticus]
MRVNAEDCCLGVKTPRRDGFTKNVATYKHGFPLRHLVTIAHTSRSSHRPVPKLSYRFIEGKEYCTHIAHHQIYSITGLFGTKRSAEDTTTNTSKRLQLETVATRSTDGVELVQADADELVRTQHDAVQAVRTDHVETAQHLSSSNKQREGLRVLPAAFRGLLYAGKIQSKEAYQVVDGQFVDREPTDVSQLPTSDREEVRTYFFMDNNFELHVTDYDIVPTKRWLDEVNAFRDGRDCLGAITVVIDGEPHWNNLVRWLEMMHKGVVLRLDANCTDDSPKVKAVKGVFRQIDSLKTFEWVKVVEKMLPGIQDTLGASDERWLLNKTSPDREVDNGDLIQRRFGKLRKRDVQADEAALANHSELAAEGTQSQYHTAQEDQIVIDMTNEEGDSDEARSEQEVLDDGDSQSGVESQTLRDEFDQHGRMPNVPPAPRKRVMKNNFKLGLGSPLLSASQDDLDSLDPARGAGCNQASTEARLSLTPIPLGSTSGLSDTQETMSDISAGSFVHHGSDRMPNETPSPPDSISTVPPARTAKFETPANSLSSSILSISAPPRAPRKLSMQHSIPRASHSRTAKEKPISYVNDIPEQDREVVGKLNKVQRKRL